MEAKKEKVKIKTIVNQGERVSQNTGKPYVIFAITLEDGRQGRGFANEFKELKDGWEGELLISEDSVTHALTFFPIKLEKEKYQKDWTFEKRKASLDAAIDSMVAGSDGKEILIRAERFYQYLNTK